MTSGEIAKVLGVSENAVDGKLARLGLYRGSISHALRAAGPRKRQLFARRLELLNIVKGRSYPTRCGESVVIDGFDESRIWGRIVRYDLKLEWKLEGRRKPVGGTDPFDLVRSAL